VYIEHFALHNSIISSIVQSIPLSLTDKNTARGGGITEETTESVAETIEPVAENGERKITKETTESAAETIDPVAENNLFSNRRTRFDSKGEEKSTSICMVSRFR